MDNCNGPGRHGFKLVMYNSQGTFLVSKIVLITTQAQLPSHLKNKYHTLMTHEQLNTNVKSLDFTFLQDPYTNTYGSSLKNHQA